MRYIVITMLLTFCTVAQANNEEDAIKSATQAVVKELGIDKVAKQVVDRYVPDFVKKYGGIAFATHKTITTGYVEFKWEF